MVAYAVGVSPVASATISVFVVGTLTFATIYADDLTPPTPLANPFTADAETGQFLFYANQASYDIQVRVPNDPPIEA